MVAGGYPGKVSMRVIDSTLLSLLCRAPEVIMGVMFDEAIDMWSLGCVLAELFLGWPLFPGACEFDQILYICQTLGPLPAILLGNIPKVHRFFNCDPASHTWSLKVSCTVPVSRVGSECQVCVRESTIAGCCVAIEQPKY